MDSKKRMMFVLDDDYYFITIKLLIVLIQLDCYKKQFVDYKKLAFIIAFMKENKDLYLFNKSISEYNNLDILEKERLVNIYYRGNMDQPIIKRILFFLQKKELIKLQKNPKYGSVDVSLIKNKNAYEILSSVEMVNDIEKIQCILKSFNRVKTIKYDTFIERIFGSSEVSKWV